MQHGKHKMSRSQPCSFLHRKTMCVRVMSCQLQERKTTTDAFLQNPRGSLSAENWSFSLETIMLQAGEGSLKVILWWWLNSYCSCLLSSREKSANEVFSFHSTPPLSIVCDGEDERGKTRNCLQKKFDRIQSFKNSGRGKGNILIRQMSTFLTLSKDAFDFFFVQAMICSDSDIIVKDFSFWVVKLSVSRLWWVQAGHRSQISSPTNQLLSIQRTSADSSWIELAILTQGAQFKLLWLALSSCFLSKPLCNPPHW